MIATALDAARLLIGFCLGYAVVRTYEIYTAATTSTKETS